MLAWPTELPAPSRYSPGAIYSQVASAQIGPIGDVLHRHMLRTLTLEWDNLANADFARLDALVDLLRGRLSTIAVPWRPYQDMIGGGTGSPTVTNSPAAGAQTIDSTGFSGPDPEMAFGDMLTLTVSGVPRLYRVVGYNPAGNIITIEPALWVAVPNGTAIQHLRNTGTGDAFLRCTMELANTDQVQGQVFLGPKPQLGRGIILAFVEALRVTY